MATSIMAVKATPKALALIEEEKNKKGEELTKLEKVRVAGPSYIPAILTGVSTIACIFGANALNKKQQAALMSAYALLDSSYRDYKRKVSEVYGEEADKEIRSSIAKDHYKENVVTDKKKQLFYDEFSERYFEATTETVLRAEYEINKNISQYGGAYLNEFYALLDIPGTDYGNHLGWSKEEMYDTWWDSWLNFDHTKVIMDDGLECCIIAFAQEPTFGFEDY